jgi:hypothetical protein
MTVLVALLVVLVALGVGAAVDRCHGPVVGRGGLGCWRLGLPRSARVGAAHVSWGRTR